MYEDTNQGNGTSKAKKQYARALVILRVKIIIRIAKIKRVLNAKSFNVEFFSNVFAAFDHLFSSGI